MAIARLGMRSKSLRIAVTLACPGVRIMGVARTLNVRNGVPHTSWSRV